MALDISQLNIQVKSDGITKVTAELDSLTNSAIKAEASTKSLENSSAKLSTAQKSATETSSDYLSKLQQQVDLLGKNKEQTATYMAANKGLTNSQVVLAGTLGSELDAWTALGVAQKEALAMNAALTKSTAILGETQEQQTARLSKMVAASMEHLAIQRAEQDALTAGNYNRSSGSTGSSKTALQMTPSVTRDEQAAFRAAAEAKALQVANADLATSFEKVMRVADPYGTKLIANAEAMDVLTRAQKAGLIGTNEYQSAMSRLLNIKNTTLSKEIEDSAKASGKAAEGFSNFSLAGARAKSELLVLGREASNGNWTRFAGSLSIFADRTGVLGSVIGLVTNPVVLAGIALAGLGAAALIGSQEISAFNSVMIATGDYAKLSSDQFYNLSKSLGSIGSEGQHAAAKALTEIASSGKFTSEQLALVGTAAVQMQESTGQAVAATAKEFEKLKDQPVKASLELNDKYHYLTVSVYEQIKALDDQGNSLGAVNTAMNALSDSIANRTPQQVANLGYIRRAWREVKEAAVGAWNAMLDVGREQSNSEKIAALQGELDFNAKSAGWKSNSKEQQAATNKLLRDQIENYSELERITAKAARAEADNSQARDAAVKATAHAQERMGSISKESKLQKALNVLKQEYIDMSQGPGEKSRLLEGVSFGKDGMTPSGGSYDQAVQAEKDKYKTGRTARPNEFATNAELEKQKGLYEEQERVLSEYIKFNKSQYDIGAIDTQTWLENDLKKKTQVYVEENRLALESKEIAKHKKNKTAMIKAANDSAKALDKLTDSFADYANTSAKLREKDEENVASYVSKLSKTYQLRQDVIDNSLNTAGMGTKQQAQFNLMLKAKEDFDKEMEDLDTKHNKAGAAGISDFVFGQETAAAQDAYDKRLAQEKKFAADSLAVQADWRNGSKKAFADYQDQAANIAQQSQTAFTNAFTGMENALVTFATTGKLSFKSFATSVLTDIARMEAKAATTQIFSLLQSLIGPMFGIGGGGGSLTQSAPASVQVYSQASGYAKGGAFNDGMQKFADGGSFTNGIVNTPTNFNIGQMGEAGPEAIVPLTRTSDGSLGIRQTGSNNPSAAMGNVNTVVNVTNSGATSQTKADGTASQAQRQFADAISSATKAEIAKQMLQGGILWRMKNGQTGS